MKTGFSRFFVALFLSLVFSSAARADVLPELEGRDVEMALPCAETLTTGQWYVMYNVGRKGFLYDDASKLYIATAPPNGNGYKYLVRMVEEEGKLYVQTGLGRYFTTLSTSNNSGTTTSRAAKNVYSWGSIGDGCFWLKDSNGMVLDANALGGAIDATATVAGWGKDAPTSATGNNSWRFFPVELPESSGEEIDLPMTYGRFSVQSVNSGGYLFHNGTNLALDTEEHQGTVRFYGDATWTMEVPEATGSSNMLHIGSEGKFSSGPASHLHFYRVTMRDDGGLSAREVATLRDGGYYLIVANHEGTDYALKDEVTGLGTASQRLLSSPVAIDADGSVASLPEGQAVAFLWQVHYGEGLTQEPLVYTVGETGGASGSGKPLLTIACISDIHTQEGWLTEGGWADQENAIYNVKAIKDVKTRESLTEAVNALKGEGVDVVIVGGDCQSDATVDEEHWRQVRRLMADALREASPNSSEGGETVPVLYVNGNHEYEVASTWGGNGKGYYNWRYTRPFNAGEYYEFPMLSDVGVLASEYDCFYEEAPNDGIAVSRKTMPVLAAYHYSIKGFDFVVLNCGKHLFHNANNYSYSDESVEWVGRKLQQIYADDPQHTKTVFFALHIPFGDSNSINTNEDKGMSYYASTRRLKEILAQYPGLVMLYGHDHGQDNAYIRKLTSQRVTRYDTNGNVMATTDGVGTFDKVLDGGAPAKVTPYNGQSVMFHPFSDKTTTCLGLKGSFLTGSSTVQRTLALLNYESFCTLFPEPDGGVSLRLGDGSEHLAYNNGFGVTSAEHQSLALYHVKRTDDTFSVERVQHVVDGELYLIGTGANVYRVGSTRSFNPATESFSVSTFQSFFWRAEVPQEAQPSFVSSFMGSMRYYNNSVGEPGNSTQGQRKLIQGLLVYVYPDRVVFNMKNFRNNTGVRVRNELAPYVVKRTTPELADEAIVKHNPSGAYYRRIDDLKQLTPGSICVLVDESRKRSIGMINNSTNKFAAVTLTLTEDGRMDVSRNASECEFVFEKQATGAPALAADDDTWYLRSHDGYLKMAESKVFHRQQAQNYYVANPLANEVINASLIPWTLSMDEAGVVTIENAEVGQLRKWSVGMTTGSFHLYQKVVPVTTAVGDGTTAFAPFYAEHALYMPDGVEAYTIEGLREDGTLRFVRQTTKVPAKTGLVLRVQEDKVAGSGLASAGIDGVVEIPVIDDRYAAPLENMLCGTLSTVVTPSLLDAEGQRAAARYYRLVAAEGFVAAEGSGSPFVNPAGEAYLVLPSALADAYDGASAASLEVLLDGADVNGIKDVVRPSSVPAATAIYNLSGQRVGTVGQHLPCRPGIYIVGGKKMVLP